VLEICQLGPAVVNAGKALGDLWGDLLENRCRQEEIARFLGLLVEHLLSQEVEESAIGRGGDRTDELVPLVWRRSLAKRDLDQLERRRPTFGAALELDQLGGIERVVVDVAEQLTDLSLGEAQRIGLQLGVAAVSLEAGELEAWLDAGSEDEATGGGRVTQDLVPEPADFGDGVYVLPVVDDECARLGQALVHLGEKVSRDPRARRARLAHLLKHRVSAPSKAFVALGDRLDQVADVERPVPIGPVELVPVARVRSFALPLPKECGLAIACVCGEHDRATV